jgi:hypothetical protein
MEKIKQKIMSVKFGKAVRKWVIYIVLALAVSAGLCGITMQKQIQEAVAYYQTGRAGETAAGSSGQTEIKNGGETDHNRYRESRDREELKNAVSQPDAKGKAAMVISGILLLIGALSFWLLVGFYLYQAAARSGMYGTLWLWLGLAGNLAALILFFIIRSIIRRKCSVCGHWQKPAHYCGSCGSTMIPICPECGAETEGSYCDMCGAKIEPANREEGADDEHTDNGHGNS